MLCTFCNTARLENEAPCQQCGAPSPLIGRAPALPPYTPRGNSSSSLLGRHQSQQGQVSQQMPPSLPQTPQQPQPFNAQPNGLMMGGNGMPPATPGLQQPISLLPVPYQPPQPPQSLNGSLMGGNGMLSVPVQQGGALVPALTPPEDESVIHVRPMYTKPRAIIPRYRAISGLLSVLIVALLFCGGAGYYAQASGKLSVLSQLYGVAPPPSLKPSPTAPLADPPNNPIFGSGYSVINSATTNSRIDPISHASAQPSNIFQVNQTIYLTYSVQRPKSPGVVHIKWYTNGAFYQSPLPIPLNQEAISGYTTQKYTQPATGMVELYWNDQLAIRLFFVVR